MLTYFSQCTPHEKLGSCWAISDLVTQSRFDYPLDNLAFVVRNT